MRHLLPKKLSLATAIKLKVYNWIKNIFNISFRETYSQLGEDVAICHIFENTFKINSGFYIDVGCNHPIIFSNTFKLYIQGWSGITIDLNEELINLHKTERKKDDQVMAAVSDKIETVNVFEFESSLIRTINSDFFEEYKNSNKLLSKNKEITTTTLDSIISTFKVKNIDLLCIDVEGHDFKVLKSLDLKNIRPKMIIIEIHDINLEDLSSCEIFSYLKCQNYKFIGYLIANGFFIDNSIEL